MSDPARDDLIFPIVQQLHLLCKQHGFFFALTIETPDEIYESCFVDDSRASPEISRVAEQMQGFIDRGEAVAIRKEESL